MNIIFFAHPTFLGSQSMPRYATMLLEGMRKRGYKVELYMPEAHFYRLSLPQILRKWMGYIDQYILFPIQMRRRLKHCPSNTLFVFTDQALGPWVPLVADRPHIIHCHDFLAQRSALGEITENPIHWSGRQYQAFIRRGYSHGKNFISVSKKTRDDLHKFLPANPSFSEIVYNGLNQMFVSRDPVEARIMLGDKIGFNLTDGYLLHVGGNQWYKNRTGVIEIYDAWRSAGGKKLPLLLIGKEPDSKLKAVYNQSPYKSDIQFLINLDDELVQVAYAGATLLLFPSLAEGFGWPIAEAMASGCPVITTNEAPMTEVAGAAGFLIPRRPKDESIVTRWAEDAAEVVNKVVELSSIERKEIVEQGISNARRFDSELTLNRIEMIYRSLLQTYN